MNNIIISFKLIFYYSLIEQIQSLEIKFNKDILKGGKWTLRPQTL